MSPTAPTRATRSRPASGRGLRAFGASALLTALLCLIAQVGAVAHLALVSHARCLEHDALVHTQTSAAHAAETDDAVRGPAASGVPAEAQHSDDHCLAVGLRRRDDWVVPPDAELVSELDARSLAPVAPPPIAPPPPVELLLLAPKSSPPLA